MNPRVLFVDDDPMLLASTRRQLVLKLPEVELVFCDSAPLALQRAAEKAPVIVFSDVRMPGMDGPELLARIAQQYPNAARFALTGQSDAQQLDRTFSVAHQVLSKPTESQCLIAFIKTLLPFQNALRGSPIQTDLTKRLEGSSENAQVLRFLQVSDYSDAARSKWTDIVEADLMLKARLLGIANSVFIAPVRPVTTVVSAISLLGLSLVGAIYANHHLSRQFLSNPLIRDEVEKSMDMGASLAIRMQSICMIERVESEILQKGILAAMLYPFGRLHFALSRGQEYLDLKSSSQAHRLYPLEFEQAMFGVSHEVAGAYVLYLGGMDANVCTAIANLADLSPTAQKIRFLLEKALNAFCQIPKC